MAQKRKRKIVESLTRPEITGAICGTQGCKESFNFQDLPEGEMGLPPGWRFVLVMTGLGTELKHLLSAEHDVVLCPEHAAQLDAFVRSELLV